MYPKLRAKFGDSVPYDKAPKEHILVEFAFDVLLVAHGGYKLQAYHDFIGFKVLEAAPRARVPETYGLDDEGPVSQRGSGDRHLSPGGGLDDPERDEGRLGTEAGTDPEDDAGRRCAISSCLTLPRAAYEREYGKDYRKPRGSSRDSSVRSITILPKIGPLPSAGVQGAAAGSGTACSSTA